MGKYSTSTPPVNKYMKQGAQAQEHFTKPSEEAETAPMLEAEAAAAVPRGAREPKRAMGRPPGKRSNPEWEQLTAYIRKDTKRAAMQRLMNENGQGARDLSEVIDDLVSSWAKQ